MKFFCIADQDTVRGFRLAGVDGRAAGTAEETSAALDDAFKDRQVGIVIMTDVLAEGIRARIDEIRMHQARPLIVVIPGPEGPMPGRKTLREFVQEAIGIQVGGEENE